MMQTHEKVIPFPMERVYKATLEKVIALFHAEEYQALLSHAEYILKYRLDWSIVRIYMASLIQLERYDQLFTFLRELLKDDQLSEEQRLECEQLLRLQEDSLLYVSDDLAMDAPTFALTEQQNIRQRFVEDEEFRTRILTQLQSESGTKRLQALEVCQYSPYDEEMEVLLISCLEDPSEEPLAKAFILQLLRRWEITGSCRIGTVAGTVDIPIASVPRDETDLNEEEQRILRKTVKLLEQKAPHLLPAVRPTWIMFLIFSLPVKRDYRRIDVWAQTLAAYCQYLHGIDQYKDPNEFDADPDLLYLMDKIMQHPFAPIVLQD